MKYYLLIFLILLIKWNEINSMLANKTTENILQIAKDEALIESSHDNHKIAFLFLTRGPLPMENIWREFFNWYIITYIVTYIYVLNMNYYYLILLFTGGEIKITIQYMFILKLVINMIKNQYFINVK